MQTNKTLIKFGYPDTLIKEYRKWILLLRPEQYTLGSLVLVHKIPERRFSDIVTDSFNELQIIIKEVEQKLFKLFSFEKINYLMLMMVDLEVHFHIIPRYKDQKNFLEIKFVDSDWPNKPSLINKNIINNKKFGELRINIANEFATSIKKYGLVYTTGAFDFLHYGHLNILEKSKDICDYLLVGVSTDELIKKEKGEIPLVPFEERMRIVSAIKYVDEVIPQVDKNKQKIVDKYNINAITVGDDWKGRYPKVTCDLVYFPYTPGISSTIIKRSNDL